MKKYLFSSVLAIAISAVFTGCSKSTDLYDEGAVQQNQHEQEVAQLKKAYNDAFTKEFGSIAANNKWGFDRTRGAFTRVASNLETTDLWIIPENLYNGNQNKECWSANAVANDFKEGGEPSYMLNDFDFNNYFIQLVDKERGKNANSIRILQAWNSIANNGNGEWQDVTNFESGDVHGDFLTIETTYFFSNPNRSAACTTLMKNMGGAVCNKKDENGNAESIGKMFRLAKYDGTFDYNYTIRWANNEHNQPRKSFNEPILVFKVGKDKNNNGNGNNPYWVMRLGVADNTSDNVVAEGRILCEDMGANDFDFNDIVFDAKIMGNGEIIITVLAHGGILDIMIDDQLVTMPQMTNTGKGSADSYSFTIPAGANGTPKYTEIIDIPITVLPDKNADKGYNLTAETGAPAQKVCVPVGTDWPDEYVNISRVYSPFSSFVSTASPADWTVTVVPELVDRDLTNND